MLARKNQENALTVNQATSVRAMALRNNVLLDIGANLEQSTQLTRMMQLPAKPELQCLVADSLSLVNTHL